MKDIRILLLNPAPSLIKYGMKWGFEENGVFVHLLEGEDAIYTKPQDAQMVIIEKKIKELDINYIFCEGYSNMPVHQISKLCKANNIRFDWWAIEDPVTPHIAHNIAEQKLVDYIWTTTEEFIPKYKNFGIDSDLLLFGCNPTFHKPVPCEKRFKHDISLIASNYSNRFDKTQEYFVPLIENKFDIMFYGHWWLNPNQEFNLIDKSEYVWNEPVYGTVLPYEWLPIVVNSSKIMLGHNCTDISKTQTSCRPFETLCSSGESVYLAYYTEAQERIFGDYIIQVKSGKEMVQKARELLALKVPERRAIALRAREFVAENHNYKIRAKTVLDSF